MRSRLLQPCFSRVVSAVLAAVLAVPWPAFASVVEIAVVDIEVPFDSVVLAAGESAPIQIKATITGAQAAQSTFKVYTCWTLSGGVWSGSAPVQLVSPPRAAQDPATVIVVPGIVHVASWEAPGSYTVVVSAFDIVNTPGAGGKLADGADGLYTVDVIQSDTIAPVITTPGDLTVEATGPDGATVTFAPTAWDETDGALPVTCAPASGSTFPLGTTIVACSAVDAASNVGTASFKVTVRDTTPPVLSLPADIVAEATGSDGARVDFSASTYDLVDGDVAVSYSHAPGSVFALGTTEVVVSATDAAGNTATGSFTVTVRDTTPPVIAPLFDLEVEAVGPEGAVVTFSASASDLVDGDVEVVCEPPSGSIFPLGTTTVVCTAKDAAGNEAALTFKVTITDTTEPMLTLPANMTKEATGPYGASVTYAPTAYDLVDGDVPVICVPPSGSIFPLGTSIVSCMASDSHGNTASGSFAVEVVDTTPPAITVPNGIIAEATGPDGAQVNFSASAVDLVDGDVAVSYSHAPGSVFPLGTTEVVVSATDAAGNSASRSFTVTVVDTTAPVIDVPADITAVATGPDGAVVTFSASAWDLVDGDVNVVCEPPSGSTFPLGTTTVICTATDAAGNTSHASFTVTVTYAWSGYLQPINANGSSVFKLGSTVPVKFRLIGASASVSNATARLYVTKFSNGVLGTEMEAVTSTPASTGNLFRYDPVDGTYIYNLGTKGMDAGTYQLRIDLGDGVRNRTVLISLRK